METTIVRSDGGVDFNRFGEQVIACNDNCGRKTTMLGTRLCDYCWEERRRVQRADAERRTEAPAA